MASDDAGLGNTGESTKRDTTLGCELEFRITVNGNTKFALRPKSASVLPLAARAGRVHCKRGSATNFLRFNVALLVRPRRVLILSRREKRLVFSPSVQWVRKVCLCCGLFSRPTGDSSDYLYIVNRVRHK